MDALFEALGFDWKILIVNGINFLILLALLYKLGFKPMQNFVESRKKEIADGIENAKKAEASLAEAKEQSEELLNGARKEAQEIISQAREQAQTQGAALLEKQQEEIARAAEKAKADLSAERDNVLRETKEQAAHLVLAATEKLLREKVDSDTDRAYVEKVLSEMNS